MKKYTVTVKESVNESIALSGVRQIDKDIVTDYVSNEDGGVYSDGSGVYSFETEHDVERALDLSDGVIFYRIESKCAGCGNWR